MNSRVRSLIMMVLLVVASTPAWGQMFPDRRHVRGGNRLYEEQKMAEAQKAYRTALTLDSLSVEGKFNLGDAQYASGDFAGAEESFRSLVERNPRLTKEQKADAYYNLGNAQFQQQKFSEAVNSYKESLRLKPESLEAKTNYQYAKAMEQQQQSNQNQNSDQNNDSPDDQSDNKQQPQQDPNSPNEQPEGDNGDESEPEQNEDEQQPEPEEPKPESTEEQQQALAEPRPESEQMLDAVQAAEDKTREKVDEERKAVVGRSGKNW